MIGGNLRVHSFILRYWGISSVFSGCSHVADEAETEATMPEQWISNGHELSESTFHGVTGLFPVACPNYYNNLMIKTCMSMPACLYFVHLFIKHHHLHHHNRCWICIWPRLSPRLKKISEIPFGKWKSNKTNYVKMKTFGMFSWKTLIGACVLPLYAADYDTNCCWHCSFMRFGCKINLANSHGNWTAHMHESSDPDQFRRTYTTAHNHISTYRYKESPLFTNWCCDNAAFLTVIDNDDKTTHTDEKWLWHFAFLLSTASAP